MPPELQVKLLRVLETGTYMRVGSTTQHSADVRVVAATNRNPEHAVSQGQLREDLLYRLNVFPIAMPPLRERLDDVALLADHFLTEIGQREAHPRRLSKAAMNQLERYRWPGNVRELRNAMQRAYVMCDGDVISDEWLPRDAPTDVDRTTRVTVPINVTTASLAATISLPLGKTLADTERHMILATLEHFEHQRERTAAALGISLKTLYNRLKAYGSATSPP